MALFTDIVAGAKFRADLVNSDRVSTDEWRTLLNEAILATWNLASSARPDFQIASQDTTVSSGPSTSIPISDGSTAKEFHSLIDVVYSPDTSAEYSLGPFAWQNRRSPGGWLFGGALYSTGGASRARLMGDRIYVEPSARAGGPYRVWYCPTPKTCELTVRLATAAALPAFTPAGTGFGHTLTANANGALSVDGVPVVAADRILVKNEQGLPGADDNGIYTVTQPGTAGTPFILTRATDYDTSGLEVHIGNVIVVAPPLTDTAALAASNSGKFFELQSFGTAVYAGVIDTDALVYIEAKIDGVLDRFRKLLIVKTAIPAAVRDDDLDPRPFLADEQAGIGELQQYFHSQRTQSGPSKMIDTDATTPGFRWGW